MSQAVLDAACLARHLARDADSAKALAAYEAERLPAPAELVRRNRAGGPEQVIDEVERRAPGGFERLEDVATHEELETIVQGYAQAAGFGRESLPGSTSRH